MKHYNVIIIGAGASGCMCALTTKNKSVAIIDCGKTIAKKIMVTGNGRCNLTNMEASSKFYNANIDKYLNKFNVHDTLEFFESFGLETYADDEGRVYPISNSAKSVVDVINMNLSKKIDFISEQKVQTIQKNNDLFIVKTDKDEYSCKKLVISTGGNALKSQIEALGVACSEFIPSLVALKCKNCKDLNGVKVSNVKVSAKNKCGETKAEIGEILFKDNGLSGIVIFNISTLFARKNNWNGKIQIDLLPQISLNELIMKLEKRKQLNVNIDKIFVGMFANALANEIFIQSRINTNGKTLSLSDENIIKLAKTIKNLTFECESFYDNNQVYSGGVVLKDLNDNLMSKKVPNLYFTGEVIDVDGECGGFNLQWAWTSGHIVGECL